MNSTGAETARDDAQKQSRLAGLSTEQREFIHGSDFASHDMCVRGYHPSGVLPSSFSSLLNRIDQMRVRIALQSQSHTRSVDIVFANFLLLLLDPIRSFVRMVVTSSRAAVYIERVSQQCLLDKPPSSPIHSFILSFLPSAAQLYQILEHNAFNNSNPTSFRRSPLHDVPRTRSTDSSTSPLALSRCPL
ncbi:hypothetical protein BC835DRAFT_1385931 [Cytidiella melzeri]|nr:hypothetical protein BC835DRAFT_1385931 [Cytidiella melzeri]